LLKDNYLFMKRHFFWFILFLSLFQTLQICAQDKTLDSLTNQLRLVKADTLFFKTLRALSSQNLYKDPEGAIRWADSLLRESKRRKNNYFEALALQSIGNAKYLQGHYAEALQSFINSVTIMNQYGFENEAAALYHNMGNIMVRWKKTDKAIAYLSEAVRINKKSLKYNWLINNYASLTVVYLDLLKQLDTGFQFSVLAYKLADSLDKTASAVVPALNIGVVYFNKNQTDSALLWFNKALELQNKSGFTGMHAIIKHKLGLLAMNTGEYKQAEKLLDESLQIRLQNGEEEDIHTLYVNLAETKYNTGKKDSAYFYVRKAYFLRDSLFADNLVKQITEMEAAYQIEVRDKENELLKKDAIIKDETIAHNKAQQGLFIFIILITLALLVVSVFAYRNKKRNLELLSRKNLEIEDQNRQLIELNVEKSSILQIVSHDFRSPLARIKASTDLMQIRQSENTVQYIQNIHTAIHDADNLIDDLLTATGVTTSADDNLEYYTTDLFEPLLHEFVSIAGKKHINITSDVEPVFLESGGYKLKRIAENLLSNAIKYSPENSEVFFTVSTRDDALQVEVKDSGQGFNEEDKSKMFKPFQKLSAKPIGNFSSFGLGLSIVLKLVGELSGTIELQSEKNLGSTFKIKIPIKNLGLYEG